MLNKLQHKPIFTIIAVVGFMLMINIDTLDVTIMEARNFITAREMILDDNWLLTTMNGEARYQKPPLPTWLTALSSSIFGLKSLFGLRLPAIIMVMITGIYAYFLSTELLQNKKQALINGLITVTSFYIIAIIVEAPWDIFAHGFMLAGIYHLFQFFERHNKYWKHVALASVFIGFSILSKAPVSVYALLLPFLIAYGVVFNYNEIKLKILPILTLVVFSMLIGGWWFLYVRISDPETFVAMTTRETGNWTNYNVRPIYYYWSFFTQSGLWTIPAFISLLYPYLKTRVSNLKAYRFTLLWTIFSLILLSIIPEKKSRYLMPVLIPLALNTGFYLNYLIERFKGLNKKLETYPVYFNFGLIGLIGMAFPLGYFFLKDQLQNDGILQFILAAIILFGIGLSILFMLKRKQMGNVFLLTVSFMICAFLFVLPITKTLVSSDYSPITELKDTTEKENLKIYALDYVSPEMIWQYGDKIPRIQLNDSTYDLPKEKKFGLLVKQLNKKDRQLLESKFIMVKKETYNLNVVNADSRQFRDRLISHYYLLTRK